MHEQINNLVSKLNVGLAREETEITAIRIILVSVGTSVRQ